MKFNNNLRVFYIILALFLTLQFVFGQEMLLTSTASPVIENSKVAYIYRTPSQIESNVVEVFSSLNLTIDYIMDSSLPMDLSKYRLVYVGDEYFTKDIPIDKNNVIIANPNIGTKDGLTKNGGVSKLTSTKPLRVEVNGKYVQVYELTKDKKDMFIPYYFLNNLMKAPSLKKYAGADTISSGENYGDVIAYGKPGDVLLNGKILQGRLCFFGINQADFWTSEARQLFLECTGFTATECRKDADCGSTQISQPYCKDGDIYKDTKTYQCLKPGTVHSKCISKSASTIVENCLKGCKTGSCLPDCTKDADCGKNKLCQANSCVQIACTLDTDCGKDKFANQLFCKDGNVFDKYITYDCINPGTLLSKCSTTTSDKLFEKCFKGCSNGDCASQCTKNSECGTDEFVGDSICQDGSVFQNKRTYTCNSPGTAESKCTNNIVLQKKITCSTKETCSKGTCVDLVCTNNMDCDDKNLTTDDFCINPGKTNSACIHTITNYRNISQIKFILLYAYASYNSVTLNFSAVSKDNTLINGYLLSRDHANWIKLPGSSTGYVFRGLSPLTDYVFYVKAIDSSNVSSDEISIYLKTLANPYQNNTNNTNNNGTNNNGTNNQNNLPIISSLKAVAGTNYVTLLYSANSANGSTIKKYLVRKNVEAWVETTKKNYTYTTLSPDTSYTFYVKTVDSLNRTSKELAITIKTSKASGNNGTGNNTNNNGTNNNGTNNQNNLPTISSLKAVAGTNYVTLLYSANSANGSTIKKYLVRKNVEAWVETTKKNYTYTTLSPDTSYIFYVKTVDSLNRTSKELAITIKTSKPIVINNNTNGTNNSTNNNGTNNNGTNNQNNLPTISSLKAIVSDSNVTLIYTASKGNSTGIKSYYVKRDNFGWVITNKPNYTFTGLTSETNYIFYVKAIDNLNRESKASNITVKTAKKIDTTGGNGGTGGSGGSGGGSSGGSSTKLTGSGGGYVNGQYCLTVWNCGDWSKCRDKTQTRECIYPANFCEPYDPKPAESRVCIPEEPIPDTQLEEFNSEVKKDTPVVNEAKPSPWSPITGAFIATTLGKHPWISLLILVFIGIGTYYYYSIKTKPLLKAISKK